MSDLEKKIIYFLLAGDLNLTLAFLKQSKFNLDEQKAFPISFIKVSKKTFTKSKSLFSSPYVVWKAFCQFSSYEECLPVILHFIFKYPKSKISYLLSLSLEVVSYRLEQGLFVLEKQLNLNKDSLFIEFLKKQKMSNQRDKGFYSKTKKALFYLEFLSHVVLPVQLKDLKYKTFFCLKQKAFILKIFLSLVVLSGFFYLVFLWSISSSEVILYPRR